MSWLGRGWKLFWRLLYVFLPFAALFSVWDLLEGELGSEISLFKLELGFPQHGFPPWGFPPWLQGLFLFGEVVVIPLLWVLALYLGFLKLQGRKLSEGVWAFLFRLPTLFKVYVPLVLKVLFGLLLLVVPGIIWGLSWMFGPLIALVRDPRHDALSVSEIITRGHRGKLFLMLLVLVILGEIEKFGTMNIAFYNLPAAAAFVIIYHLLLLGLTLGAILAAFVDLSQRDVGRYYELPVLSGEKPVWNVTQVRGGLAAGMVLVGVVGYLAFSVVPLWVPLKPLPPLDLPELPRISQKANLILGTEHIEAMAPGPGKGEITLVAEERGLEIRSVPDLSLIRFIPVDITSWTYAVALSPTGKEAVLTGLNFMLLVRLSDGKVLWRKDLGGRSVAFSPKGDVIAVGHENKALLFDPRTGDEIVTFVETDPRLRGVLIPPSVIDRWENPAWGVEVKHLSFSPDGSLLAVSMQDPNGMWVYVVQRIPSGEVLSEDEGFATFSPNGELVVGREDYLACLDPLTAKKKFSVQIPEEKGWRLGNIGVRVAVNAKGDKFALWKGGVSLYLIDRRKGSVSVHEFPVVERREPLRTHLGSIKLFIPWVWENHQWGEGIGTNAMGPLFAKDHVFLFPSEHLYVFEPQTGRYVRRVFLPFTISCSLSINPQGDSLFLAPSDAYMMNLYSLPKGIPKMAVPIEEVYPTVKFSPNGNAVAIGDNDTVEVHFLNRSLNSWYLGAVAKGIRGPLGWWRGKVLVSKDSYLGFLDPKTGAVQTASLPLRIGHYGGWELKGDRLMVFDRDTEEIRVIDVAKKTEIFSAHFPNLTSAALSPTGELLALGFPKGRVEVRKLGKRRSCLRRICP